MPALPWIGRRPLGVHVSARLRRRIAYGLSSLLLVLLVGEWALWVADHLTVLPQEIGIDYRIYTDAAARWLAGGSFYPVYQLSGPYELVPPAVLYPPTILPLLLAFTVAPGILWWLVPVAITAIRVLRLRPGAWSWSLILFGLAWTHTTATIVHGTPTL
ncbi:MAG TPA: hypothetical protein VK656_04450, partial [Candidatus Acidoferrum sp.]|nr:hypothetical protein [Candidatus Acidoferrum sp.]